MDKRKYTILDLLVFFIYALAFLLVIVNFLWFDHEAAVQLKEQSFLVHYINSAKPLFVVFGVSTLLTWMIFGGADSRLWKWLPPLCCFFWCNRWQKWVLISVIIFFTLFGMIVGALGLF